MHLPVIQCKSCFIKMYTVYCAANIFDTLLANRTDIIKWTDMQLAEQMVSYIVITFPVQLLACKLRQIFALLLSCISALTCKTKPSREFLFSSI